MRERLEFYLRDVLGFAYDVVNAVLAAGSDDVVDAIARAEAVSRGTRSEDFASISFALSGSRTFFAQAKETNKTGRRTTRFRRAHRDEEKELAAEMPAIAAEVRELRAEKNYERALTQISQFTPAGGCFLRQGHGHGG